MMSLPTLPAKYQKHEIKWALFMVWVMGPCLLSLLGFYLGTIFGDRYHVRDLQTREIEIGGWTALAFLAASFVVAIIVTAVIPKVVERDRAALEEKWAKRGEHGH